MDSGFVAISIRCPRCLAWSVDDADFCHLCGQYLRPMPEEALFRRSKALLSESSDIIGRLARNMAEKDPGVPARMEVRCAHCQRWRDHRRMKSIGDSGWLCFDHVDCQEGHDESLAVEALVARGFGRREAEEWMARPLLAFDGLSPRRMIADGRSGAVMALIAEADSGLVF